MDILRIRESAIIEQTTKYIRNIGDIAKILIDRLVLFHFRGMRNIIGGKNRSLSRLVQPDRSINLARTLRSALRIADFDLFCLGRADVRRCNGVLDF